MRKVFQDDQLDREFRERGYVILPLIDPAEAEALAVAYHELVPAPPQGFHCSMYRPEIDYRRAVYDRFQATFGPALARWLENYRICTANFMVKPPRDPEGAMRMHQDWSFVDEPDLVAVHVWCATSEVNQANGCMSVVAGSHWHGDPVRPHADDFPFREVLPLLVDRYLMPIPLRPGQAILYHGGLVHGSPFNGTDQVRIGASCITVPREAVIKHTIRLSPTEVETFAVSDEFFWTYELGERPRDVPSLGRHEYVVQQLSPEQVLASPRLQAMSS